MERWIWALVLATSVVACDGAPPVDAGADGDASSAPDAAAGDAGVDEDGGQDAGELARDSGLDAGTDSGLDGGPDCIAYRDMDRDGYGDPEVTRPYFCRGFLPDGFVDVAGDCYDLSREVYPDAPGWRTVDRGDGSFDWNCDGVEELQYPDHATCEPATSDGTGEGWTRVCDEPTPGGCLRLRPVPGCGGSADFQDPVGCIRRTRFQHCR
ncbi:MAG: hypothetical protein VYE22_09965 [Myxococcota bacterium]|nr:hypothetical protein [Myxococcota bacterium]